MKTIIAAFSDGANAQQGFDYLRAQGITDIQMLTQQDGNIINRLADVDVPADRARLYAEVMRRGAPLLVVRTDDSDDANELANALDSMGSLDLDAAAKRWDAEGWAGFDNTALPFDANARANEQRMLRASLDAELDRPRRPNIAEGGSLDVIEEKVEIGKRDVSRGGVRLRSFVVESPVQEEVELYDERIEVTREPVDERISAQAADSTFTEDELVVTARGEEVVVGKEARVVERVHVGKSADTRTETISETERRRDVEVENIEDEDRSPNTRR